MWQSRTSVANGPPAALRVPCPGAASCWQGRRAAEVGGVAGEGIRRHAPRLRDEVDVPGADLLVQVDELRRGDRPVLERAQAVLDADVAPRPLRVAVLRAPAEDVDRRVLQRAAH